jgi:hypothetical protein
VISKRPTVSPLTLSSLSLSLLDAVNRLQSTVATENMDTQVPGAAPVAQNLQMDSTFAARKFYAQRNM